MSSSIADVIVSSLRDAGVRAIFGVPGGGSSLDLIDAAGRAGLPFVLTATETAAALAAMAQAEITGHPGACATGLGPGAASVVNGVACASLDRAPLVVITDAAAADTYPHQRIDQRALLAPLVRWSSVVTAENVQTTLHEALARATARPPGPVHLQWSGQSSVIGHQSSVVGHQPSVGSQLAPLDSRLKTDDCRLETARRPLLLLGLGARGHAAAIRAFMRSHNVPAMVTYKAKGVVSDRDVRFAGVFTNGAIEREIVDRSDLLIAVGLDRVELLPRPWTYPQPIAEIDGDVDGGLRKVAGALGPSAWDTEALQRIVTSQRHRLQSMDGSLTPDRVVSVANDAAPEARVTVDAGAHMFPATWLWPVDEPNQMLISNGLSTMGFALPAAIGAAVLDRSRRVVALTGDGGLLMCAGELATLARERLPVVVVVFDDRSLSLIDVKQRQRQFNRAGVALGDVDWPTIARGFGLTALVASTAEELAAAMASALAADGPSLIDVHVDPAPYADLIRVIRG